MNFELPFRVEVRAVAASHYTREHIERRLKAIADDPSPEAAREREYLARLERAQPD